MATSKTLCFGAALAFAALLCQTSECRASGDYPYSLPSMGDVSVTGGFWLPRIETNRLVTLRSDFAKCRETGRIANFTNAAVRAWGTHKGMYYDDSDVYKVMEGAAYCLAEHPDPELDAYMTWLIGQMAKAQEPDGYLYTARTLGAGSVRKWPRWEWLHTGHELYNMGHMIEAAVALKEATGRTDFMDIAVKNADLICRTFGYGPTEIRDTSGHQEIELALCRLFRATGERRYLEKAKFFLDMRGRRDLRRTWGVDLQDHLPVLEQNEALGHAVRAAYMYSGMADVSVLLGERAYADAIARLWENVVSRKLHLTGGIGARRHARHPKWGDACEAFSVEYDLPNEGSYLETCAAIANALWNVRMFRISGESKYIDVAERAIYNNVLSGVSLRGDEFFYQNPMASKSGYRRFKWTGCSCCPVNVVRFIPQVPTFAYAARQNSAYVNLFVESDVTLHLGCGDVKLSQKTDYPWSGDVRISVAPPEDGAKFALNVRIPGWCVGQPVPSDLYRQVEPGTSADFAVKVNGHIFNICPWPDNGYCVIDRAWKAGDTVEISMNMPVRRIKAHDKVVADKGRLAFERGPVVYCAEGEDNEGRVRNKAVASDAELTQTTCCILGNTYPAFTVPATAMRLTRRDYKTSPATLKLIPYFAWCHRSAGEMQTWFPVEASAENALPVVSVKASHCNYSDTVDALFDSILPSASDDLTIPRFTFWSHLGTDEWVECSLEEPDEVTGVEVYWFDDEPKNGRCRLPKSWRVQWRPSEGAPWQDIGGDGAIAKNRFCALDFPSPVNAQAVRLRVKLQEGFSGGILELRLK